MDQQDPNSAGSKPTATDEVEDNADDKPQSPKSFRLILCAGLLALVFSGALVAFVETSHGFRSRLGNIVPDELVPKTEQVIKTFED